MIIYLDVFLLENFIVNIFLLVTTSNILRINKKYLRLILSAILSAIYSLSVIIPNLSWLCSAPVRLIFPVLLLFIAYPKQSFWKYIKIYITFLCISFLLAGICFSFQTKDFTLKYGLTMKNISYKPLILALMIIGLIIDRLITSLKERYVFKEFVFPISIANEGCQVNVLGFLDTGNELREPATNLPVIILESKAAGEMIKQKRNYLIPYKVIDGSTGFLEGFIPKEILITKNNNRVSIEAVVCITEEQLSRDKEYCALLSRGVIGV